MKIFFTDLDGTLEDSRQDMSDSVNAVRSQLGLRPKDIAELYKSVNRGMDELYRVCFADYLAQQSDKETAVTKIRIAYESEYLANVTRTTKLYEGIFEVIPRLREQGHLVLVTNKPAEISEKLLANLGVRKYYDVIMGGDSCPENKPSPLPLKLAAEKLGYFDAATNARKAFMIGDTLADVKAGQGFGAKTVWCAWGYLNAPPEFAPDFVANHPRDLLEICSK